MGVMHLSRGPQAPYTNYVLCVRIVTSSCSGVRSTRCPSYSILTPWGWYSGGNSTPQCRREVHLTEASSLAFFFLGSWSVVARFLLAVAAHQWP